MATSEALLEDAIKTLQTPVPTNVAYSGVNLGPAQEATRGVKKAVEAQQTAITDAAALNSIANADLQAGQLDQAAASAMVAAANADRAAQVASKFDVYRDLEATQKQMAASIAAANVAIATVKPTADAELETIRQMQSVALLDDPLEWAYNQIQLPNKIKAYNAAADQINTAQSVIDVGLNNVAGISAGAVNNIPAITAAQAAATAEEAAAKAKIANALADEKLAKENVDFATKNTAAQVALAGVTENTTRLQQREAELKYQSQIQAINIADNRANRLLRAAEYQEKLQTQEQMQINLSNYEKVMGLKAGSMPASAFKQLPKERQLDIIAIGATGKYGFGPEDALSNFRELGYGQELSSSSKGIISFLVKEEEKALRRIDQELTVSVGAGKLAAADKAKERKAKLDEALTTALNEEIRNPESKLFAPATPREVIASGALPPNSVLATILKPIAETNAPVNIETVYQSIRAHAPGSIQAQGDLLAQYAKIAKQLTLQSSNVTAFGANVKPDPRVLVSIGDPILQTPGGDEIRRRISLDITDPVQARKFVLIKARPELPGSASILNIGGR